MSGHSLEILTGNQTGAFVEVDRVLILGRNATCGWQAQGDEGAFVSGEHAVVEKRGDSLAIRDLASTNGTFVNGNRVDEILLSPGDLVSLGSQGPRFRVAEKSPVLSDSGATRISPPEGLARSGDSPLGDAAAGGKTFLLAKKIIGNGLGQTEFGKLMSDKDRLQRMVKRGLIPAKVGALLTGMARDYSRRSRRFLATLVAILLAATLAVTYLIRENRGYRSKLNEQQELLAQIQEWEVLLREAGEGAEGDEAGERYDLVHRLARAEARFLALRKEIKANDRLDAYAHPLGWEIHAVLEELGKKGFIVPETFIQLVEEHVNRFTAPDMRATLEKVWERKPKYAKLVREELLRKKLPEAFFYVAMQESLLDPLAQSPAGARGLWQFMPVTARGYGLQVPENWEELPPEADERTNARLATRAAANYLHRLYVELGDAPLAMSAYNSGGGRMRRVLHKIEDPVADRDFWYMYRLGLLNRETAEYVPKIIAIILIDRNRERYGFAAENRPLN